MEKDLEELGKHSLDDLLNTFNQFQASKQILIDISQTFNGYYDKNNKTINDLITKIKSNQEEIVKIIKYIRLAKNFYLDQKKEINQNKIQKRQEDIAFFLNIENQVKLKTEINKIQKSYSESLDSEEKILQWEKDQSDIDKLVVEIAKVSKENYNKKLSGNPENPCLEKVHHLLAQLKILSSKLESLSMEYEEYNNSDQLENINQKNTFFTNMEKDINVLLAYKKELIEEDVNLINTEPDKEKLTEFYANIFLRRDTHLQRLENINRNYAYQINKLEMKYKEVKKAVDEKEKQIRLKEKEEEEKKNRIDEEAEKSFNDCMSELNEQMIKIRKILEAKDEIVSSATKILNNTFTKQIEEIYKTVYEDLEKEEKDLISQVGELNKIKIESLEIMKNTCEKAREITIKNIEFLDNIEQELSNISVKSRKYLEEYELSLKHLRNNKQNIMLIIDNLVKANFSGQNVQDGKKALENFTEEKLQSLLKNSVDSTELRENTLIGQKEINVLILGLEENLTKFTFACQEKICQYETDEKNWVHNPEKRLLLSAFFHDGNIVGDAMNHISSELIDMNKQIFISEQNDSLDDSSRSISSQRANAMIEGGIMFIKHYENLLRAIAIQNNYERIGDMLDIFLERSKKEENWEIINDREEIDVLFKNYVKTEDAIKGAIEEGNQQNPNKIYRIDEQEAKILDKENYLNNYLKKQNEQIRNIYIEFYDRIQADIIANIVKEIPGLSEDTNLKEGLFELNQKLKEQYGFLHKFLFEIKKDQVTQTLIHIKVMLPEIQSTLLEFTTIKEKEKQNIEGLIQLFSKIEEEKIEKLKVIDQEIISEDKDEEIIIIPEINNKDIEKEKIIQSIEPLITPVESPTAQEVTLDPLLTPNPEITPAQTSNFAKFTGAVLAVSMVGFIFQQMVQYQKTKNRIGSKELKRNRNSYQDPDQDQEQAYNNLETNNNTVSAY